MNKVKVEGKLHVSAGSLPIGRCFTWHEQAYMRVSGQRDGVHYVNLANGEVSRFQTEQHVFPCGSIRIDPEDQS